jgi:DNA-binding response OmpR family regulator
MHILIVDDEHTATAVHGYHVRRVAGCTAACFAYPREALEWAASHRVDAVIVDYLMPDIDGIEFTRRFRLLPDKARVPVLMVTGCVEGHLKYRARTAGVDEFLTKPVNYGHLSARLLELYAARSKPLALLNASPHADSIEFRWRW